MANDQVRSIGQDWFSGFRRNTAGQPDVHVDVYFIK
jgi:hypothetical protein